MKFDCGPTPAERLEQLKEWHDHFALIPQRVESGDCRWWEMIQRRYKYRLSIWSPFEFEYRAKPDEPMGEST